MSATSLTDFLLARIAEDEAAAREVAGYVNAEAGERIQITLTRSEGNERWSKTVEPYDPARVLAKCEAKRAIVERFGREVRQQELNPRRVDLDTSERFALRTLAAVYSDHPDYRDEWLDR